LHFLFPATKRGRRRVIHSLRIFLPRRPLAGFLVRFLLSGLVIAAGTTLSFVIGRCLLPLLAIDFREHDG